MVFNEPLIHWVRPNGYNRYRGSKPLVASAKVHATRNGYRQIPHDTIGVVPFCLQVIIRVSTYVVRTRVVPETKIDAGATHGRSDVVRQHSVFVRGSHSLGTGARGGSALQVLQLS